MAHPQPAPLSPVELAGITVVVVALAAQVLWFILEAQRRLNVEDFAAQLRKLVAAGNPERALKLAEAASGRPAGDLARAMLAARAGEGGGFEQAFPRVLADARRGLVAALAVGGVGLLGGGAALLVGLAGGASRPPVGLVIALLGLLVFSLRNGTRWTAWPTELTRIRLALSDL